MSVTGPGCERCDFKGTVQWPGADAWVLKPCDHCGGLSQFNQNPNTSITIPMAAPDSGEDPQACIARLTRQVVLLTTLLADAVNGRYSTVAYLCDRLDEEVHTRLALRAQEARIMGILADAGVPVGDVVRGVEVLVAERDAALHQLRRACSVLTRNIAPADPFHAAQAVIEEYRDVSNERDQFEELAIQRSRWSRLWHAEARRLWREVQALSDPDAPYTEVDPEEFMREIGGE